MNLDRLGINESVDGITLYRWMDMQRYSICQADVSHFDSQFALHVCSESVGGPPELGCAGRRFVGVSTGACVGYSVGVRVGTDGEAAGSVIGDERGGDCGGKSVEGSPKEGWVGAGWCKNAISKL